MTSLVEELPADLERRFGGLARLYGAAGAQRIRQAHIVVVGLGGVGSWAAEAAARSGVARLTLIDLDHIAESNINRQVHALDSTLGQAKVQAMRERIAQIHPGCRVDVIEEFVDAANWPGILGLEAGFDRKLFAVIDACDQVRAKTAMAAWAMAAKVNLVSVGAAGGKRLAHRVDVDDLSLVTHDPLLAQLRYRLRKEHGAARKGKIGVACVFSREAVLQPGAAAQTDGSLNCHGYGSVVSVTSTFGLCAAGWALDKIAA
ncbi:MULTISPECIES: ThiF family adenylyltransferase [unclassified Polaromonas]|uniref:tRNA threonylcarbamoyladenosine dehydratase n=1 Tax=unclassified Polaromonas TaxID=2638319 RepID=UPI000F08306A|nr:MULTISPECIES: tRNA threonylcarbamoyladenosine dehydratase [unclassified Polaromonas]AYQ29601.1 tRNA threonylcarbamoyladenosine dehydratase [Polaromonas sp. SP1]QGJ19285.1 tRNA threonylcarbamoyladenosine dehydratase [Polaromonas sp. Pch-P]